MTGSVRSVAKYFAEDGFRIELKPPGFLSEEYTSNTRKRQWTKRQGWTWEAAAVPLQAGFRKGTARTCDGLLVAGSASFMGPLLAQPYIPQGLKQSE